MHRKQLIFDIVFHSIVLIDFSIFFQLKFYFHIFRFHLFADFTADDGDYLTGNVCSNIVQFVLYSIYNIFL